jgi:Flp pilus assembly protein TadG
MRARLASFIRDRSGAAAAEMVLVMPLLLVLIFAGFEGGNYFWNEHIVVKAVRDGARFAGRQSFGKFDCASVTDATVETQIKNLTRTGQTTGGTARVSGWVDTDITVSVSCDATTTTGIYAERPGGAPVVTVTATVPYTSLFGALGFDTSGLNLAASAQSAVMGI